MSHGETPTEETHQGKSSPKRLGLLAVIMLVFAVVCFLPSLFSRGGTGLSSTGTNYTLVFIPLWLGLTIMVVAISMWFAKFLMTAEKYRDSETPSPATEQPHTH